MKCIAFVVMMAVATQASYYESAPAISYQSVVTSPVAYSYSAPAQYVKYAAPAPAPQVGVYADHYSQKAAPVVYQAAPAPAPVYYSAPAPHVYSAPVIYKSAPAPVIVKQAPVIVKAVQEEAKYTAINRGSLHEAPLPGHAYSQTSVNLEPAPGTH